MDTSSSPFDTTILRKAGLTESQAKGYLALIEHGKLTPTELGKVTDESRTNAYMICEKLEKLGLATKNDDKKVVYAPNHPGALESLAERRRKAMTRAEQEVKNSLSPLIELFYAKTETPGVQYLNGKEGIAKIYDDILRTNQPLHLVRTPNEKKYMGPEIFKAFVANRIAADIHVDAITPFTDRSNTDPQIDAKNLLAREFFPEDMYTAPLEIDIYGSKVGFLSFGEDPAGVIIDNKNIAEGMKQLFSLAKIGANTAFNNRPELVAQLNERRLVQEAPSD